MRNVISIHGMVGIPGTKAACENNVSPMDKVMIATQNVKTQELPPYI